MKPYPYQREGIEFLLEGHRAILADEPGLGKTVQALMAARGRTLIVAPAAFESIWSGEVAKWSPHLDTHDFTFATYSKLSARKGSATLPQLRPEWQQTWDTVICDEAHYLKNPKANWTRAASKLKYDRLYLLTGTPIPNWAHEMLMLLRLLYPGDRRFSNYWRWVEEWFETWEPPWGGTKISGLRKDRTWEQYFKGCGLDGRWLRRLQQDVLGDLPPLRQQTITLELAGAQKTAYRDLRRDMYHQLESGEEVLAWSSGGLYTKLHRVSTGLQLETDKKSSNKLDMLEAILEERKEQHTLVLGRFRDTVKLVDRLCRKLGLSCAVIHGGVASAQRGRLVEQMQDGKFGVMAATIDTIAEGFTLTRADCVIFVERHPRPSKNEQARKRIHRIGQTRPCLQIDLVSKGTVDERLVDVLRDKTDAQLEAMSVFDLMV